MSGCCYPYQYCIPEPSCTCNQTIGWKEGDLSDRILYSFSRMNEQIYRGMREIQNDIKISKLLADNAYELHCDFGKVGGDMGVSVEKLKVCNSCVHKSVCRFKDDLLTEVKKVEDIMMSSRLLKVECDCLYYISQEKHAP